MERDSKKVNTVSVDDVQWMHFEDWPEPPRNASRFFKIKPRKFSSKLEFPISQFDDDLRLTIGNVSFTQFGVNSNVATAGHKFRACQKMPSLSTHGTTGLQIGSMLSFHKCGLFMLDYTCVTGFHPR